MTGYFEKRSLEEWAFLALMAAAFSAAFSLVAGRAVLIACVVLLAVDLVRRRVRLALSTQLYFWLFFVGVVAVATAQGVNPRVGFGKMSKLIWFMGIPACVMLVTSMKRFSSVLKAYAAGAGVEALKTLVLNPVHAVMKVKAGSQSGFLQALVNEGSMTYAQVLMLGIVVALGFVFVCRAEGRSAFWWWVLLVLLAAAEIAMFKRGSWVCTCILLAVFLGVRTNWRYVLALLLVIGSSLLLPPVRARLVNLRKELDMDKGGRIAMWFKIAPALVKEHPFGIGYRVLTPAMMKKVCMAVEPNRNHLHSNVAQILVETGWIGLFYYLFWMAKTLMDVGWVMRRVRAGPPVESIPVFVLLLMVVGLFANGLVEYNFGDAEVVLSYGLVLGCSDALRRITQVAPA